MSGETIPKATPRQRVFAGVAVLGLFGSPFAAHALEHKLDSQYRPPETVAKEHAMQEAVRRGDCYQVLRDNYDSNRGASVIRLASMTDQERTACGVRVTRDTLGNLNVDVELGGQQLERNSNPLLQLPDEQQVSAANNEVYERIQSGYWDGTPYQQRSWELYAFIASFVFAGATGAGIEIINMRKGQKPVPSY